MGSKPEVTPLSTCSSTDGTQNTATQSTSPPVSAPPLKKKCRRVTVEDKEGGKQKRHDERMQRQDQFLSLMERLVKKLEQ